MTHECGGITPPPILFMTLDPKLFAPLDAAGVFERAGEGAAECDRARS